MCLLTSVRCVVTLTDVSSDEEVLAFLDQYTAHLTKGGLLGKSMWVIAAQITAVRRLHDGNATSMAPDLLGTTLRGGSRMR